MMRQAAQDLNDGETRHESREAEDREQEEVQWTKHASRSDSQAQQPDLTSRGGVLGECVCARCPHHRSTTTNTAQPQRVGVLLPMPSCLGIGGHPSGSRQGHPRYTGAQTTGRPWVAHTNAQRAKCTCHDAYSRQSNTQVFRQTCLASSSIFYKYSHALLSMYIMSGPHNKPEHPIIVSSTV